MLPSIVTDRFLHGFQQRRLRLRRSTVDFVGKNDVREDRPFDENADALSGRPVFFDDFRSRDVGRHQVRRELNAFEIQMQHLGDGRDQQRLRQTRDAGDDGVAAGQHRDHHLIDDFLLSDDDLANFVIDLFQFRMKPLDDFKFLFLFNAQFHELPH